MKLLGLAPVLVALCACKKDGSSAGQAGAPVSPADTAPLQPALEAAPAPATPEPTTPDHETAVDPIGFDWGPPCRVPAVQDVDDDGKRARGHLAV